MLPRRLEAQPREPTPGGSPTTFSNANNVKIGQDSDNTAGLFYGGLIDEVRLWSTARSGAEIAANWKTSIDSATGLVASWHFNDALTDASGNGNTLTGTGSPGYSTDIPYTDAAVGPANLKSYNTNVKANIKTINTNPIANVKSLDTNV